jgi:hypothetical protein
VIGFFWLLSKYYDVKMLGFGVHDEIEFSISLIVPLKRFVVWEKHNIINA